MPVEADPEPEPACIKDSIAYQSALSEAQAGIRTALRRRQLDPLRYIVTIDAGLPIFAMRDRHQLRIAYNHYAELAMETTILHEWLLQKSGNGHERFLLAVDELVLELKSRVQAAGRTL